ncbi:MAG: hypothetical protein JO148_05245 [Acidimicrobiia bacterium]|nr:hypothetical protein [Acidimicrobiia bacterium]
MDRRTVLGDRRTGDRRRQILESRPFEIDRRSGFDRRVRAERRRVVLPPLSRLVPALIVVAVTLAELAAAQATGTKGWPLLFIVAAFPLVAYDLANPGQWRRQLVAVWVLVSLYVLAAGVHIGYMLAR